MCRHSDGEDDNPNNEATKLFAEIMKTPIRESIFIEKLEHRLEQPKVALEMMKKADSRTRYKMPDMDDKAASCI